MRIKKTQTEKQIRNNLKDGNGDILFMHYVDKETIPHCRLLAEMTIPRNGSIGKHAHVNETEIYIIKCGTGITMNNGHIQTVEAEDVIITRHNEFHSIKNTGYTPLIMTAIIITH